MSEHLDVIGPLKDGREAIGAALHPPATVNGVLLAVIAGGLRRWLGSSPHLRAQIPVSLHHRDEAGGNAGNHDSFINVDLPLAQSDPLQRLELIRDQTSGRNQRDDAQEFCDFLHALGRMPIIGGATQRLVDSSREFSLLISNVPGPPNGHQCRRPPGGELLFIVGTGHTSRTANLGDFVRRNGRDRAVCRPAGTARDA